MAFHRGPKTVTDGLVLYLDAANPKSYPGSGTAWSDLSGNGNTGTLTNGPTFDTGNNGSIVFDGANDYNLISGASPTLDITENITMISWVKPKTISAGWQGIFLRQTIGDYELWLYGNKLRYGLKLNGVSYRNSGNISLLENNWYMLCWTYDGTYVKLYVNTIADLTFSRNGSIDTSNSNIYVGYSGYASEYFNGHISICQLYNRALSDEEILQNYNATRSRFGL